MGAILETETGLPPQALLQRWQEVLRDPLPRETPYRVELNRWGTIEMTPVRPYPSRIAKRLADALEGTLGGEAYTKLAVALPSGLRVPDVAWCSPQFLAQHAAEFAPGNLALSRAPELCVEVMSDSNTLGELKEKADGYLAAGAQEAWIVLADLSVRVFGPKGERVSSQFSFDLVAWAREASVP